MVNMIQHYTWTMTFFVSSQIFTTNPQNQHYKYLLKAMETQPQR